MSIVIKVENLSKQYRLGSVGTGSLAHDLNRAWHRVRGKEDPYLQVGDTNDRTSKGGSEYVWALKDINFDVHHGEVLGIIGRNGAGKSTLLKILSRTTSPTTGSVKIKGRVASLLEVGTGFHPELSGRENIFLNGAILGMTKQEIKSKFDEIVDFAGVERYIDTPVKRYSSGMYVRLAFGVAAHLEPEILIVDEVLAVGDAEFQKKALGKMKDVSERQGRTVLFVSHNIRAIKNLCQNALLLTNGRISSMGKAEKVIENYENSFRENILMDTEVVQVENITYYSTRILNFTDSISNGNELKVEFIFDFMNSVQYSFITYVYREGELAFCSMDMHDSIFKKNDVAGRKKIELIIPPYLLNPGHHSISIALVDYNGNEKQYFYKENVLQFHVEDDGKRRDQRYNLNWGGAVSPLLKYSISDFAS